MLPLLYLALAACTEPDDDGTRWDPTSGTWTDSDTATSLPTSTTPTADTAPPAPTADTGGAVTEASCDGEGPLTLQLGHGGRTSFEGYGAGDPLPIVRGPASGEWGVTLELLTTGLDTSEPMSAVMRVITDNTDTTYIGVLMLQCPTPGPGWVSLHADFPDEDQGAAGAGQFDGDVAEVSLTLTDHRDLYGSAAVQVVLDGP